MNQKVIICFFSFFIFPFNSSFAADPSSANFSAAESYFPSARGDAQSSSYKIGEGGIDTFQKGTLASTNYGVEGKIGISGTEQLPYITAIAPAPVGKFLEDENASFTVTASTPDSDSLQYRVRQDGTSKAGPQSSSTLSWALSGSDRGRHTFSFEAIDPQGTVAKSQAGYVYRRPVK